MKIVVDQTKGIAPLELLFSVDTMVKLVKWLWNFGDGSTSVEQSPRHVYVAPGIYTVSLTVTDEFGNQYSLTKIDYIYVYAYPIGAAGLLSGYTDFCIRHAVKASQGQGITLFGGTWIWPMIVASTAKGNSENHDNISLVINSDDMRIYRIGIPELWTDRAGTYEESEIPCEAKLPEIVSRYGEHENVRHVETHVSMRSWDELNYRGKDGYTADGFRNGHVLSIEGYQNGEQIIPSTVLREVIRGGDYAFMKELEARRLQLKFKYSTSAFRTTRIASHCQELDHRTAPQLNDIVEKRWQREFILPDIWFCRNKPSVTINRADGVQWTGSGVQTTGPDKKQSAFVSSGLQGTTAYVLDDFTFSAWISGQGTVYVAHVQGGGTLAIEVVGDEFRFNDGINNFVWLMEPGTWRHLAVVRRGGNLEVYQDGKLRMNMPLLSIFNYGGNSIIGIGKVFDERRIPRAVSANALEFYYDSVLDGGGGFLP